MKIKQVLIWASALAIVVFIVWFIAQRIEFYDSVEHSEWSSKAKANPYLAAIQFLKKSDIDVIDLNSLNQLKQLQTISTLLVTSSSQIKNPRQLDKILTWVKQGGNLIVSASLLKDDIFLNEFSVRVEDIENDQKEESFSEKLKNYNRQIKQGKSKQDIEKENKKEVLLTMIKFSDMPEKLKIAFNAQTVLQHPYINNSKDVDTRYQPFSWSSSKNGVQLMQFSVAKGVVTILSNASIWNSFSIGRFDHAFLLWLLIDKDGSLAILHNTLGDSIWTLAKQYASEFLVALSVLLAFFIWYKAFRFGRIEQASSTAKRSLGEHFYTTANYLWHRQGVDALLTPLREKLLYRSYLKLGQSLASQNKLQHFELLSQYTGIDMAQIQMAFESKDKSELSFIKTVQILKKIETLL